MANRGRLTPAVRPPLSALVADEDMTLNGQKLESRASQLTLPVTQRQIHISHRSQPVRVIYQLPAIDSERR